APPCRMSRFSSVRCPGRPQESAVERFKMLEIAGILRDRPGEVCDADSLHHDIADRRIGAQLAARNRCQDRLFDVGRKLAGKSLECFGGIVANDIIVTAHPGDEAPWPA